MEIFYGLLYFLDRGRRPLAKVIPELPELRADPASVLQYQEVVIPSALLLGWSILCAFWVAIPLSWCLLPFLLIISKLPKDTQGAAVNVYLAVLFLLATFIANCWLRRRRIVLGRQGVEFHRKGKHVFCPWAIFQVSDPRVHWEKDQVRMDVNPDVMNEVELHEQGAVIDTGRVRTKSISFEGDQLIIEDCFQAAGSEIANLIYEVAQKM